MPVVVVEIERTSSRTVVIVAPTVEPRVARVNKPREAKERKKVVNLIPTLYI